MKRASLHRRRKSSKNNHMPSDSDMLKKGYRRVKDLEPDLDDETIELIHCMVNGHQGQDMEGIPWFVDRKHFDIIMEESGAIMFLK